MDFRGDVNNIYVVVEGCDCFDNVGFMVVLVCIVFEFC